jgi:DNA-binding response OmpR family regulator
MDVPSRAIAVTGPRTALGYTVAIGGTTAATGLLLVFREDVSKTNWDEAQHREFLAIIDLDAKLVTRSGSQVRLTPTEYRLLEVLATNAGRLCTHRFLLEQVCGDGYGEESQYLRVYVANLRRKLDDPAAPRILLTEPGMGYRFVADKRGGT